MHENRETSGASRANRDRSGKANNHKPDRHAAEESHSAVVPMKLPNKEAGWRIYNGIGVVKRNFSVGVAGGFFSRLFPCAIRFRRIPTKVCLRESHDGTLGFHHSSMRLHRACRDARRSP